MSKVKTLTLISVFLCFSICVKSQHHLGENLNYLKWIYPNGKESIMKDGKHCFNVENKDEIRIYYFNDSFICNTSIITPYDSERLKSWISLLNENYTEIDFNTWRQIVKNGKTIECKLDLIISQIHPSLCFVFTNP